MADVNRRWLLASRPEGTVERANFEWTEEPVPSIGEGELLVRNLWLSCDPAQRGWMERETYRPAIPLGEVVDSVAVGEVVESNHPGFAAGDLISGLFGWQDYAVSDAGGLWPVAKVPPGVDPTIALSLLGINGLTAYFGLLDIGQPKPGETVLVSGAAGSTGSLAAQIAKLEGCRVIGIAGGERKCSWLTGELGLDEAIDYKSEDVRGRIAELCPRGVDVFFDNVGGEVLDAALANLARGGRVVLCGAIATYDDLGGTTGPRNYMNLVMRGGTMRGFLVFTYLDRAEEAIARLAGWAAEGKMRTEIDVVEGLERAPDAFRRLFTGENLGKQLVKVADPSG